MSDSITLGCQKWLFQCEFLSRCTFLSFSTLKCFLAWIYSCMRAFGQSVSLLFHMWTLTILERSRKHTKAPRCREPLIIIEFHEHKHDNTIFDIAHHSRIYLAFIEIPICGTQFNLSMPWSPFSCWRPGMPRNPGLFPWTLDFSSN